MTRTYNNGKFLAGLPFSMVKLKLKLGFGLEIEKDLVLDGIKVTVPDKTLHNYLMIKLNREPLTVFVRDDKWCRISYGQRLACINKALVREGYAEEVTQPPK